MSMLYPSRRSMETLALGLLASAIERYRRPASVSQRAREDGNGDTGTRSETQYRPA